MEILDPPLVTTQAWSILIKFHDIHSLKVPLQLLIKVLNNGIGKRNNNDQGVLV